MYPDSSLNLSHVTEDAIYFFSHGFDPLNNWSAHTVEIWSIKFPTLEHGYHYKKFDESYPDIAALVLAAPSPWAAKQIEREHGNKRREDWEDIKVSIMTELLRAKVAQNQDVKDCLQKTGKKAIIENSPWDGFWGIGENGKGQNQIGKILMMIRDEQDV